MNILFLSRWFPDPPSNGSKLRIFHLLRGLAQEHRVSLISFSEEAVPGIPPALAALCASVQGIPYRPYDPASGRSLRGLLDPAPRFLVDTYHPEMARAIQRTLAATPHHLVIASQLDMAAYRPLFASLPAIFEEVELGVYEAKREQANTPLGRWRHDLTLFKLRRYLRRLLPRYAASTVVSEPEAALLQRTAPRYGPIEIIPNCVNLASYRTVAADPQPHTLIFTGAMSYFANHDAMQWFVGQVYPLIQARVPQVRLTITGNHADRPLPVAMGVTRTGFVDDVRPLVAGATVSVVPVHLGGGTRLKILEAMALRTPVVTTSKGAEGLAVRDGTHLLVADTPDAFAEAVVRLLQEPGLRQGLTEQAYRLVRERYDWSATLPRFLDLVERVGRAA